MTGGGQLIERVIPKRLRSSSVRQARPIPHAVVQVIGLVNLGAAGGQLVQNRLDLRRRIIPEALCTMVAGEGRIVWFACGGGY